jgi:hypothetical protein
MIVCEPLPTRDCSRSPCWKKTVGGLSRQLVDPPSSPRLSSAVLGPKRPWPKLTVFRAAANRSAAFQSGCLGSVGPGYVRGPGKGAVAPTGSWNALALSSRVRCGRPGLTRRSVVSTLKQSPESRRYGCDPGLPGDRAGQQQDYLRPTRRRTRVRRLRGRTAMRDTTRRTSWPRASGPSSRTTGAEPACMVSDCGCVPGPDARLCRVGAVRGAARYLPDRKGRFFGGAFRTQPHEAVN